MAILSPHTHGALFAREKAAAAITAACTYSVDLRERLASAQWSCERDDMAGLRLALDRVHLDAMALHASLEALRAAAGRMLAAEVARQSHEQGGT